VIRRSLLHRASSGQYRTDRGAAYSIFLDGKAVNIVYTILVILIFVEVNNEGVFHFSKDQIFFVDFNFDSVSSSSNWAF
jgi:hypothetical protein